MIVDQREWSQSSTEQHVEFNGCSVCRRANEYVQSISDIYDLLVALEVKLWDHRVIRCHLLGKMNVSYVYQTHICWDVSVWTDWCCPPHAAGVSIRKFLLFCRLLINTWQRRISLQQMTQSSRSSCTGSGLSCMPGEDPAGGWTSVYLHQRNLAPRWKLSENLVLSNQHRCDRTKHKIFIARSEWKQPLNTMFCSQWTWPNTIWSFWLMMMDC